MKKPTTSTFRDPEWNKDFSMCSHPVHMYIKFGLSITRSSQHHRNRLDVVPIVAYPNFLLNGSLLWHAWHMLLIPGQEHGQVGKQRLMLFKSFLGFVHLIYPKGRAVL